MLRCQPVPRRAVKMRARRVALPQVHQSLVQAAELVQRGVAAVRH